MVIGDTSSRDGLSSVKSMQAVASSWKSKRSGCRSKSFTLMAPVMGSTTEFRIREMTSLLLEYLPRERGGVHSCHFQHSECSYDDVRRRRFLGKVSKKDDIMAYLWARSQ